MPEKIRVTGLMSGSSLDGVDLACCEFQRKSGKWEYRIIQAETLPYPDSLLTRITGSATLNRIQLHTLDVDLGQFYADLLNSFHQKHGLSPVLVASHGHTIMHDPGNGITFQAGEGGIMANSTGIRVVNDFRSEDVAQGGQGAPLVPVGDRLLFGDFDACLNLGGFANISFENSHKERIAYDIGPANLALNWIAGLRGFTFDRDGLLAESGRVHRDLLEELNRLKYYSKDPPKSLGKEWFEDRFLPIIKKGPLDVPDRMATIAEHIAMQLSSALKASQAGSVLVTGGGALNRHLMKRLRELSEARITVPDKKVVQYKEALIFALLGLLRTLGEINCLSSVTGGRKDLSTGMIHNPKKMK